MSSPADFSEVGVDHVVQLHVSTFLAFSWGRRGHGCMLVGFTVTYATSDSRHRCCDLESRSGRGVQHYLIKFVSDLRQVCGFLHQ